VRSEQTAADETRPARVSFARYPGIASPFLPLYRRDLGVERTPQERSQDPPRYFRGREGRRPEQPIQDNDRGEPLGGKEREVSGRARLARAADGGSGHRPKVICPHREGSRLLES